MAARNIPSFNRDRVASRHDAVVVNTDYSLTPFVLHTTVAGTVTVVPLDNVDAEALTYVLSAGQTLPILIKKVTAVATLAAGDLRRWQ